MPLNGLLLCPYISVFILFATVVSGTYLFLAWEVLATLPRCQTRQGSSSLRLFAVFCKNKSHKKMSRNDTCHCNL